MEQDKSEEIVAYRIGEGLFCKDCYEEAARTLKAVQRPEDPQVTVPAKPIKAEDVEIFICKQCKTIKGINGPSEKRIEIPSGKDLSELRDTIEKNVDKIHFIEDFFSHNIPLGEFFSDSGKSGFYRILVDLEDDLTFVVDEISRRLQKGLIVEKGV